MALHLLAWPGAPLAIVSAALFGASTPFAKLLLGDGVDPWLLAGLLYLGSGVGLGVVETARRAAARARPETPLRRGDLPPVVADVVGPVCETGDFLARDREMANAMPGDYLAVCTAGAYGFVQSSNYNSRPRAPEVLVEGDAWRVIRERESYQDLVRGESV